MSWTAAQKQDPPNIATMLYEAYAAREKSWNRKEMFNRKYGIRT